MEFWEFLLQQEGDRSWLPLESANVEILEGRYRIVARSSRPNTILEIKVTQPDPDEMPSSRRIQKRSGKTNPQGLVVIMPFTRLQPGDWELRCTGDLMDDMLGNGWSQTVHLQVLPIELDFGWQDDDFTEATVTGAESVTRAEGTAFYLEPDSTLDIDTPSNSPSEVLVPPIELPVERPVAAIASSEILVENPPVLAQVPEAAAIEEFQTTELQPTETEFTETQSTEAIAVISPAEIQTLCLVLPQETWVAQRNQSLTLTGTIAPLEESAGLSPPQLGQLRIRLFDPQNSKLLFDHYYSVQEDRTLPIPFACELSLPTNSPIYLMLGELALYGIAESGKLPPVLATQSFNVTTELHELLETIANNFPNPDLALPPQATVPKEAQLAKVDLSFFNIPPVTQTVLKFQSSDQNFLPPQLHPKLHPKLHSQQQPTHLAKTQRLDLPSFSTNGTESSDRPPTNPEETAQTQEIIVLDTAVIAEIVANISNPAKVEAANSADHAIVKAAPEAPSAQETAIAPAAEQAPIERVDELIGDWDEDWEIAADGTLYGRQTQRKEPASAEERAFQSLNLQNRFLNRLQTLATDPEISDWLREPTPPNPANSINQEIVVDDDKPALAKTNPVFSFSQASEPVPIPQVEVPAGELIAGQPINITVRLPKSAARIYAKLWVRDRQLRILIENPRWLIDFKPDGFGALKAQTVVTLPLGCMEVQFEAIAIEMTSQSESQRTIVCCSVISPELSVLSLEELGG